MISKSRDLRIVSAVAFFLKRCRSLMATIPTGWYAANGYLALSFSYFVNRITLLLDLLTSPLRPRYARFSAEGAPRPRKGPSPPQ